MVIDETLLVLSKPLGGIQLETNYHNNLNDVNVLAEAVRLQQVVTNLLSNAIDALEEQENKIIQIDIAQHPQHQASVLLSVSDNGPGISAEMLETLFDPFQSSKSNSEGLGLGLAISHSIMSEFRGTIEASRSELGGARLSLQLLQAHRQDNNTRKDLDHQSAPPVQTATQPSRTRNELESG